MNRETILNRLRAMQRRTTANGCTEAEALAAAEKLAKLMDRYGFSQLDLATPETRERIVRDAWYNGRPLNNMRFVMVAVADYCDCKTWYTSATRGTRVKYVFLGRESDVMFAHYLMSCFQGAMDRGWANYRDKFSMPKAKFFAGRVA